MPSGQTGKGCQVYVCAGVPALTKIHWPGDISCGWPVSGLTTIRGAVAKFVMIGATKFQGFTS